MGKRASRRTQKGLKNIPLPSLLRNRQKVGMTRQGKAVRNFMTFFLLLLLWVAPAAASREPTLAPAPEWVQKVDLPAPDQARAGAPFQSLLLSAQTRYDEASTEYYLEWATIIQHPQGLSVTGNIVLPWQPDRSELRVHKVHILRGGKVIDVLASGQSFTVLRRENNLESAMLDGVLTAALQPEGLSVGDTVNVAFTVRTKPDSLKLRGEQLLTLFPGLKTRKVLFRQIWPQAMTMRWHADEKLGKPRLKKTALGNELSLELSDAESPAAPAGAPARFSMPAALEISPYSDWGEISSLLAPAYAKSSTLGSNSPLQQEIRRIVASAASPEARAMAALRLVQDQIRYLALTMGEGGYVPATADQTWARKYGDCKGKTVTLLALLKGLGIEAEPVLVHTVAGDGLKDRLPQVTLFNHVIVKARIGGRSYWLDGTGSGDRRLEDLTSSPFHWGLPIRAGGASLERLPLDPPALPTIETSQTFNASNGFFGLVPSVSEVTFRGDAAKLLNLQMAQLGRAEFLKQMKESDGAPDMEKMELDAKADDEAGTFTIRYSGNQRMDWYGPSSSRSLSFKFGNDTIEWEPQFDRPEGSAKDVPFALEFPVYLVSTETIILPDGGKGFTLVGKNFDRTVAGTHIARTLSLENGKASARSSFRRLRAEISADEAKVAKPTLAAINADNALVRAPPGYAMSERDRQEIIKSQPSTAPGLLESGYHRLQLSQYAAALKDFDKALELDPSLSRAHANKAVALAHLREFDLAEAAIAKAAQIDQQDFVVHQARGMVLLGQDKAEEAVAAFTRSLELDPKNVFNLASRATAYERLGKLEEALADISRALASEDDAAPAYAQMARLNAALGRKDAALSAIERAIALEPGEVFFAGYRGNLLKRFGRDEEAQQSLAQALKLLEAKLKPMRKGDATLSAEQASLLSQKISILSIAGQHDAAVKVANSALAVQPDNVAILTERCRARVAASTDLKLAEKDCNLAVEYGSGDIAPRLSRGLLRLKTASWDSAISDFDEVLAIEPEEPRALYGRGLAKLRKDDRAGGERDFAAARRYGYDVHLTYQDYGLRP